MLIIRHLPNDVHIDNDNYLCIFFVGNDKQNERKKRRYCKKKKFHAIQTHSLDSFGCNIFFFVVLKLLPFPNMIGSNER